MNSSSQGLTPLPPVEQLWAWYCEHGSLHRIEAAHGFSHSRMHRALLAGGYRLDGSKFTAQDDAKIREYYRVTSPADFDLVALTAQLQRPHHSNVCRRARELGLTDQKRTPSSAAIENMGISQKAIRLVQPHPKGMSGKKHTAATKARLSEKSIESAAAMSIDQKAASIMKMLKTKEAKGILVTPHTKTSWKSGWHEIGGKRHYFRSHWEVNYAYYLEWLKGLSQITEWEYEPKTFWFESIRRGTRSYLPDFRVTEVSGIQKYHEVKGWMDDRSVTKLKRMAKYYPDVPIVLIDSAAYRKLARQLAGLVPGWS